MGIDQSYTSSGVCIIDELGNVVKSMVISSNPSMNEFERTWSVAQAIKQTADQFKPTVISIEGLAFGGRGDATRKLAGLQFVIVTQLMCSSEPCYDVRIVAPTTLKKHATGSGKADKKQMLLSVPDEIKNSLEANYKKTKGLFDIVDAYFLATYSVKLHNT
jgi:Holliday junction resolvasome RuvABC endonuclease subunit